jgi:dienelactone hydrolase
MSPQPGSSYPGSGSSDGNPGIVPLLALSGGLDDWTPAARCVALANMPANHLMIIQVYRGTYYAFDVQGMRELEEQRYATMTAEDGKKVYRATPEGELIKILVRCLSAALLL